MYIFYSFLKTGWIRPVQNGIIWKTEATFDAREKKVQDQYMCIASKLLLEYFLCQALKKGSWLKHVKFFEHWRIIFKTEVKCFTPSVNPVL